MAASNGMRDYFIHFLDGQNGDDGFCSLVCSCIDGTERDLERWIAKFFYDEIAQSLTISVETVKEHVQNILRKIAVTDRTQAAVWAVRRGLV